MSGGMPEATPLLNDSRNTEHESISAAAPEENVADASEESGALINSCSDDCCWEADSCCGCCDVQIGTKIIAIMCVVQGFTQCMSIDAAGYMATPTLIIGAGCIAFGMYGFWGATQYQERKLRVFFYWLVTAAVMLAAVGTARVLTSQEFCATHNCIVERYMYAKPGSEIAKIAQEQSVDSIAQAEPGTTAGNSIQLFQVNFAIPEKHPNQKELLVGDNELSATTKAVEVSKPAVEISPPVVKGFNPKAATAAAAANPQVIPLNHVPIYKQPCFLTTLDKPSASLCTETQKLTAVTTIMMSVPLYLFFAFVVRSFYRKVARKELPVTRPPEERPVRGRPIVVGQPVPPLAVYEAAALDGAPQGGRYSQGGEESNSKGPNGIDQP